MAYTQKDNTFSLFKNQYKDSETKPDYKGTMTVNGEQFEIAGWVNDGQNGKYIAGRVQKPYVKKGEATPESDDSQIPF